MLDYLVEKATPEEILAFQISEAEQQRTIELLDKQDEGTLTSDEAEELELIGQADLLIMSLQTRVRRALRQRNSSD
jgi:hypothetical protein